MFMHLLCLWVLIIGAIGAPLEDAKSEILEESSTNDGSGNYNFSFKTSNGLYRKEVGTLINEDRGEKYVVRGIFSYTDPDGKEVIVYYTADENGYVVMKPIPPVSVVQAGVPGPVLATLLG